MRPFLAMLLALCGCLTVEAGECANGQCRIERVRIVQRGENAVRHVVRRVFVRR